VVLQAIQRTLSAFPPHVCHRVYTWLTVYKLLRDQGMPRTHLNTVFRAIILAKITYALPAWRGFLAVEQIGLINSFLKRAFKYGLCSQLFSFLDSADDADQTLFNSMF